MHSNSIDDFRHPHVFLGETHERNERKTWVVIAICTAMMIAEIFLVAGGSGRSRSLLMAFTCQPMLARF